jgi:rare lipoprotein A
MSNRMRSLLAVFLLTGAYGCMSAAPAVAPGTVPAEELKGLAGWYGQEFAGRTTANGEIFDPMLMTAAHRTLPFGTLLDVKNPKSGQMVRVRINDRGPFVGNRIIDLAYAAAQQIGLTDAPSEVELAVIQLGRGEKEPPVPFSVTIASPSSGSAGSEAAAPPLDIPMPSASSAQSASAPVTAPAETVEVSHIDVTEEHGGISTETRKQVAPDGRTIQRVPVVAAETPATETKPPVVVKAPANAPRPARVAPPSSAGGRFVIQIGAFAQEANAKALQGRLKSLGHDSFVDRSGGTLYRVRMGPYATREQAMKAREALESAGVSAIVMGESAR